MNKLLQFGLPCVGGLFCGVLCSHYLPTSKPIILPIQKIHVQTIQPNNNNEYLKSHYLVSCKVRHEAQSGGSITSEPETRYEHNEIEKMNCAEMFKLVKERNNKNVREHYRFTNVNVFSGDFRVRTVKCASIPDMEALMHDYLE